MEQTEKQTTDKEQCPHIKKKIGRTEGFCMVALYAVYAVYIIVR